MIADTRVTVLLNHSVICFICTVTYPTREFTQTASLLSKAPVIAWMAMIGLLFGGGSSPDRPGVNCSMSTIVLIESFQWIGGFEHLGVWNHKCRGSFFSPTFSMSVQSVFQMAFWLRSAGNLKSHKNTPVFETALNGHPMELHMSRRGIMLSPAANPQVMNGYCPTDGV